MNNYPKARNRQMTQSRQLVAATETPFIELLNLKMGKAAGGTFDVIINDHIKYTHQAIATYMYDGKVVLYPHDDARYAWLTKYRLPGGAINLSAFKNSKHRTKLSVLKEGACLDELVIKVFDVLQKEGLTPLSNLVAGIQQSYGYVPPHMRGLGANGDASGNSDADVNDVILKLITQLETTTFVSTTKTEGDAVLVEANEVVEPVPPQAEEVAAAE